MIQVGEKGPEELLAIDFFPDEEDHRPQGITMQQGQGRGEAW